MGSFRNHNVVEIIRGQQNDQDRPQKYPILIKLQECDIHKLPIEYSYEEPIQDDAKFEFTSVIYGC